MYTAPPKDLQGIQRACKFKLVNCAQCHINNTKNHKIKCLKNVIEQLSAKIVKLGSNIKGDCFQKIEILDRDIKALKCDTVSD